jgi:hypothetical protein
MCEKTVVICEICPKGMMVEHDGSDCGLCVNDPNDCTNAMCTMCPANMTRVDNGKCCGECIAV